MRFPLVETDSSLQHLINVFQLLSNKVFFAMLVPFVRVLLLLCLQAPFFNHVEAKRKECVGNGSRKCELTTSKFEIFRKNLLSLFGSFSKHVNPAVLLSNLVTPDAAISLP